MEQKKKNNEHIFANCFWKLSQLPPLPRPSYSQNALVCTGAETLYHRDDALLYIAYVMLIWAAPIPADRWHCSLWP